MEVLADEELVGLDDDMKSGSISINLPAEGLHEQLVFRRVKQKLRLQCSHEFFPRRELAGGIKKSTGCLFHFHLVILDRNCVLKITLLLTHLAFGVPSQKNQFFP